MVLGGVVGWVCVWVDVGGVVYWIVVGMGFDFDGLYYVVVVYFDVFGWFWFGELGMVWNGRYCCSLWFVGGFYFVWGLGLYLD